VDKKTRTILKIASGDVPLVSEPFDTWARRAGVGPDEFVEVIRAAAGSGIVRRFGAVLAHTEIGMKANAMVAWEVPSDGADRVGEIMAGFPAVSHCYLRRPAPGWSYTLYTMIHAKDDAALNQTVGRIAQETGIVSYVVLRTVREFKKTSPDYLGDEDNPD